MCSGLCLVVSIAGCAYRPLYAVADEQVRAVVLLPSENRTPYAGVLGSLDSALVAHLRRAGVAVRAADAPRLKVVLLAVTSAPRMLRQRDGRLAPIDNEWTVRAEMSLFEDGSDAPRQPTVAIVEVTGTSHAGPDVFAEQAIAQRLRSELMDVLARRIAERLSFM